MARPRLLATMVLCLVCPLAAWAGDWPQWRFDAQRSAASPAELPPQLHVNWVLDLPKLAPAWPDQAKMQFDAAYEPIVAGKRLFLGSSHDNSVTAYDTATGREQWTYFTDGPVRFAPDAWNDKLYFVSDDGYLYCLKSSDGSLVWRFRGGPSEKKILGNERLISMWPARGAPVIAGGKVYFAAGIWPFMGIFLHALDAETGQRLWTTDGDGSTYIKQPHNADSFAGVAPQGPLVAIGDKLLIPGGRSVPACYDRQTGKLIYYQLAENAKRGGGYAVSAVDQLIFNGPAAFDLASESHLGAVGDQLTFSDGKLYDYFNREVRTRDLTSSSFKKEEIVDRKGAKSLVAKWSIKELGKANSPQLTALIKAGSRLYAGTPGKLFSLTPPEGAPGGGKVVWEAAIEGTPASLVAADGKLFASTLEGRVYCFGDELAPAPSARPKPPVLARDTSAGNRVAQLLQQTGIRDGYCLLVGNVSDSYVRELAAASDLRIVALLPDSQSADRIRAALKAAHFGAAKVSVVVGSLATIELPQYLASLAVVHELPADDGERAATIARLFSSLRPFGGVAALPLSSDEQSRLKPHLTKFDLHSAAWNLAGNTTLLSREGPLPDTADWTHEHADPANTRVSKDKRVKAPLGLLWFGGPGNEAILPRHGHGPQPQVCQGRAFIEGMDIFRAIDIYTGRLLWEASLPGVGKLYNNTAHQPGANSSGTNFIATADGVFVALDRACVKLDPKTGQRLAEYQLPLEPGAKEPPQWGYLNVDDNYLIGGANPLYNEGLANSRGENDNYSSSRRLVVMDRSTGKVLWTAPAQSGFRHNAICLGGGRLYTIDRISGPELSRLRRRGESPAIKARLTVFDLASGKELWSTEQDVFGTWLSYSAERDVLVEAGRVASDTISDEPKGMRAYRADTGAVLWENKSFAGPAMLHHDTVLMAGRASDLLTGAPRMREHPLSGEPVEWTWSRNYGCNTPMASEHLLTFRSGAAGYLDFCNDGGTGNFGGFRSSCSNNLIVAGGLLTAPDYTRTCVCSYQNQTSIALVPMADVETWTSFGAQTPTAPVRRLGINLAAPGDRKADDGTLWLEYPSVGGASPTVAVKHQPRQPQWFRRHSSQVSGPGLNWVAASGAEGLSAVQIQLASGAIAPRRYTVRLHFLEPHDVSSGERVFDVKLQGTTALKSLDIVREAGGQNQSLVKELTAVEAADELAIELVPAASAKIKQPLLSGIEIQAEGW